jgi:ATP-dependent DNA helicase RecQ
MACKLPVNRTTLLEVSGVGQTKLDRYGDAFIKLIDDYIHRDSESVDPHRTFL